MHRQATGGKVNQGARIIGAVDFQGQRVGCHGDVVQAQHLRAGRAGLHRHPGAGRGIGLGLGGGELLAQQHQAKVHISQRQALGTLAQIALRVIATGHTGKGLQAGATHAEHVHPHLAGRLVFGAVVQGDSLAAFLKSQRAFHGHKSCHVKAEVAAGAGELAQATIKVKAQAVRLADGAGGHRQCRGALAVIHQ